MQTRDASAIRSLYANQIFAYWEARGSAAVRGGSARVGAPAFLLKWGFGPKNQACADYLKEYYDLRCDRDLHQMQIY
jgi:hypothetical protein